MTNKLGESISGGNIMMLSEKSKNRLLPILDKPMTEDEYLDTLSLDNLGVDYGSIMSYDPIQAQKYNERMKSASHGK